MLFQQHMRLPIDNEVLSPLDSLKDEAEEGLDQQIESLLDTRERAFRKAESNITAAQKSQKETYDRRYQPQVLPTLVRRCF